jgi:hypothetical protein
MSHEHRNPGVFCAIFVVLLVGCAGKADLRDPADGAQNLPRDSGSAATDGSANSELSTADAQPDVQPADGSSDYAAPPYSGTKRAQLTYYAIPHPDDEFQSWSLIENDSASYPVMITLTRGEATGYCAAGYPGYQPALGELPPGNDPSYQGKTCKQNRIGSTLAFFSVMCAIDPYIGPMPTTKETLTAAPLAVGTPGQGCAASSNQFEIWTGPNMTLVFFDLGDGNLTRCEVAWAISQTRRLRGSRHLPALPEKHLVAAGFRNKNNPNCYVYDHADHLAVHQAIWDTNFGLPGGQYGRTCTTDTDQSLVKTVSQYHVLKMLGDQRVGAFQKIYGWLSAKPWPTGAEAVSLMSAAQAFWRRF